MRSVTGKEFIAKLKAADWSVSRIHDSHHILVKGDQAVPVPVPVHRAAAALGKRLVLTLE